jgi:hypothetical protein
MMTAEPTPIAAMDDGNFISSETMIVVLGECRCPGRPHSEDTAEVLLELPWDVMIDVGMLFGGAAYRRLVQGSLVSWNLVDAEGDPVPTSEVVRLRHERWDPIVDSVNASYERSKEPLPNVSGAPSRRSQRESASPTPTRSKLARGTR